MTLVAAAMPDPNTSASLAPSSAAITASEYGILPNTRVSFSVDRDRLPSGRSMMLVAIRRLIAAVDGDFVLVTPYDRPMLWRRDGRVIVDRELTHELAPRERPAEWHAGTVADLPERLPLPPEFE